MNQQAVRIAQIPIAVKCEFAGPGIESRATGVIQSKKAAAITLAGDMLKGLIPVLVVKYMGMDMQTVALVGLSGSGKSTLVSLIARFYEHDRGEILLDNVDVGEYQLANLRQQIAIVTQQVTLFNDTVFNNIAYGGMSGASSEDVHRAAEAAHAMEFISALPMGMATIVGEDGVMLSGGQRQRLAIARAILKDAPVLILDEATSALDTESEQYIKSSLDELMKNRTTLVIAHRLSTIKNADRIIVVKNGRIVEAKSNNTAHLNRVLDSDEGAAGETATVYAICIELVN